MTGMPTLEPSFYALYKQGRFRTRGPSESGSDDAMQQKERFAVAMLAFVLKYDDDFQQRFIKSICGLSIGDQPFTVEINVEIDGCGDLELRIAEQQWYFLEFKIGSPKLHLKPKQDPNEKMFWKEGYGDGINNRCKEFVTRATYIVLGRELMDFKEVFSNPKCLSRTWDHMYRCGQRSPIAKDLFKSFGLLKIDPFTRMITKEYKLAKSATDAGKLHALLEEVAKPFGFRKGNWEFEADGSSIGKNFSKDNVLGWYGYQAGKAAVCFYCTDRTVTEGIKSQLSKAFPDNKSLTIDAGNVPYITQEEALTDQDWFELVLAAGLKTSSEHRKAVV